MPPQKKAAVYIVGKAWNLVPRSTASPQLTKPEKNATLKTTDKSGISYPHNFKTDKHPCAQRHRAHHGGFYFGFAIG